MFEGVVDLAGQISGWFVWEAFEVSIGFCRD